VAPDGYGKSRVLDHYAAGTPCARLDVATGSSFSRFVGELAEALAPYAPGLLRTLVGAYERALQNSDPAAALATWFARHLESTTCTIVIDDLQQAADPLAARFVAAAVERSPAGCRWIIASESLDQLPVAIWLAQGIASLPIDEEHLRLTPQEARSIASELRPDLAAVHVDRLRRVTDGVVGDFTFLLRMPHGDDYDASERDTRFEARVEAVYASLEPLEQKIVLGTALLPALDPTLVERATSARGLATLERLRARVPEIFEPDGARYHSRFRAFLSTAVATSERHYDIAVRTAEALEAGGNVVSALAILAQIKHERAIVEIVERHGFACLESDSAYVLRDAIAALGEDERNNSSAVLALLGISAALRGRSEIAESYFRNALERCETSHDRMRVRLWYGVELLRRGRPEALDLFRPDEDFTRSPAPLRVATMSALGAAYAFSRRLDRARFWIDRTLGAAERQDPITKARVFHQASWVALQSGEFERAKDFAQQSIALAESNGAFEVAAGALSVLYNVSADVDEDLEAAAEHLRRIAVCGAKFGSIEKQLYALIAAYEIETERGDRAAIDAIEADLRDFDLQRSPWFADEGVLPSHALQASWKGDFERALRILAPTADQQVDAERRALRWSEIALYAAAAGERRQAVLALASARRRLKLGSPSGPRAWRSRLYCALTFVLLGRPRLGARLATIVGEELPEGSRRLRALGGAILALADWRSGDTGHLTLVAALDGLRRQNFAGLARLIENLPAACVDPLPILAARGATA
jgi:tetratricopeptide (TPR) repeat protein